jgi:hypothetical protein
MVVLLGHLPRDLSLSETESEALDAFKEMASDIAKIKQRHSLKVLTPKKQNSRSSS